MPVVEMAYDYGIMGHDGYMWFTGVTALGSRLPFPRLILHERCMALLHHVNFNGKSGAVSFNAKGTRPIESIEYRIIDVRMNQNTQQE